MVSWRYSFSLSFPGRLAVKAAEARAGPLERRCEGGEVWVEDVSAYVDLFVATAAAVVVVVVVVVVVGIVAWERFRCWGISTHRNLSVDILWEIRCLFCLFD